MRGVSGLEWVTIVFNSFILYSIDIDKCIATRGFNAMQQIRSSIIYYSTLNLAAITLTYCNENKNYNNKNVAKLSATHNHISNGCDCIKHLQHNYKMVVITPI